MKRNILIAFAILIALLALTDANFYLQHFGFRNTDSDQTIYWNQCRDIAEGEIHSLFLYGQDYNFPLESWLAAPLIKWGLPLSKALPLIGMVMMMLSFMLLSYRSLKMGSYLTALLALGYTLLLPVEWQVMTTIPRGFFAGIFVGVVSIAVYGRTMSSQFASYLIAILALLISANSVLLTGAFYLIQLFKNEINWKPLLIAIIAGALIYLNVHLYMKAHASEIIHRQWSLNWTWDYFTSFFPNFNQHFKGTAPVLYVAGGISILILIFQLFLGFRSGDSQIRNALLVFLAQLIVSFGVNKVHDGTGSVFFPLSRMYLSLPLVILLFSSELEPVFGSMKASWISLIALILISAGLKFHFAFDRLAHLFQGSGGVVKVYNTATLKNICQELDSTLEANQCKAYVLFEKDDALNYGSMALNDLSCYHPQYERRHWIKKEVEQIPVKEILFIDQDGRMLKKFVKYPWEKLEGTVLPLYRLKWDQSMQQLGMDHTFAP